MRPEFAEINHKQVCIGGRGCDLSQAEHPSHLNSHRAPKGRTCVQVRTASLLKSRSNFGKAAEDRAHPSPRQKNGNRAEISNETNHSGR